MNRVDIGDKKAHNAFLHLIKGMKSAQELEKKYHQNNQKGILGTGIVDTAELLKILWEEELQTLSREEKKMLEEARQQDKQKK